MMKGANFPGTLVSIENSFFAFFFFFKLSGLTVCSGALPASGSGNVWWLVSLDDI